MTNQISIMISLGRLGVERELMLMKKVDGRSDDPRVQNDLANTGQNPWEEKESLKICFKK